MCCGQDSNLRSPFGRQIYSLVQLAALPPQLVGIRLAIFRFAFAKLLTLVNSSSQNYFVILLINKFLFVSRDRDLNPGPTVYKTVALPLSYLGRPILRDPVHSASSSNFSTNVLGQNNCPACKRYALALRAGLPLSYAGAGQIIPELLLALNLWRYKFSSKKLTLPRGVPEEDFSRSPKVGGLPQKRLNPSTCLARSELNSLDSLSLPQVSAVTKNFTLPVFVLVRKGFPGPLRQGHIHCSKEGQLFGIPKIYRYGIQMKVVSGRSRFNMNLITGEITRKSGEVPPKVGKIKKKRISIPHRRKNKSAS